MRSGGPISRTVQSRCRDDARFYCSEKEVPPALRSSSSCLEMCGAVIHVWVGSYFLVDVEVFDRCDMLRQTDTLSTKRILLCTSQRPTLRSTVIRTAVFFNSCTPGRGESP